MMVFILWRSDYLMSSKKGTKIACPFRGHQLIGVKVYEAKEYDHDYALVST